MLREYVLLLLVVGVRTLIGIEHLDFRKLIQKSGYSCIEKHGLANVNIVRCI